MSDDREPMSLNQRNQRILHGLSQTRPRNPNPNPNPVPDRQPAISSENEAQKVKIDGRRRLCKLKSVDDSLEEEDEVGDKGLLFDSPSSPKQTVPSRVKDCGESIRDILDDLTSRLDSLSVDKPKAQPRTAATTVTSRTLFSPAGWSGLNDEDKKWGNVKKDDVGGGSWDVDDSDDCVLLGSTRNEGLAGKKSDSVPVNVWDDDDDDDDDGCENGKTDDFVMPGTGFVKSRSYRLSGEIAKILYPHQVEGLKWLWTLHCKKMGGILGDDMGLGKTMQVSSFLAGLFSSQLIKRALIVAPKTLLAHWIKELTVVGLSDKIRDYSGPNAKTRDYELQDVLRKGGILLTTYDIVRINSNAIRGSRYSEEEVVWDYTVLDEGHIIKNPSTQRSKSIAEIPSDHRIIISGTPIQNNLKELWALFNFCCPEIFGDKDMFKMRYENPILRGNDRNASDREKHIGSTVAKELRERIKPYFLRRMKSEVFVNDDPSKEAKLSQKTEMIVWLKLTPCQRQLYEAFLKSEWVHSAMEGSPLAALTILKKICDHPLLLTKKAAEGVLEGMDAMLNPEELGMVQQMARNLAYLNDKENIVQVDDNVSCKISFILYLLDNLIAEGHIVLIFSQTRKMLNLIQDAITLEGYKFLRIDGTTKISDREKIVKEFQEGSGAPIFLLTSQVGGLGLTLTKADRVIVVDPAWNPSTDNQSVDRAYRIGQQRDVLVYRLMTCGTIEEKIYKMQVFKGGLSRTATEHKEQTRYFSQKDMRELFSLPEQGFDISLTQQQLQEEHGQQHSMNESMLEHVEYLKQQGIAGVSDHSLLFSKAAVVPLVQEDKTDVKGNIIIKSSTNGHVSERPVNASDYAFNPKAEQFTGKRYTAISTDKGDSPEIIEMQIKRLSKTLDNKALVSRLPDSGEKIRKQISELNTQLREARDSAKKEKEVINIDDFADDFQRVSV